MSMDSVLSLLSTLSTRMPASVSVRRAGCTCVGVGSGLTALRTSSALTDTRVICADQTELTAHACVLAAASPVLCTRLTRQETVNPASSSEAKFYLCTPEVTRHLWESMLTFIYAGNLMLPVAELSSFLEFAGELDITDLQVRYDPVPTRKSGRLRFKQHPSPLNNNNIIHSKVPYHEPISTNKNAGVARDPQLVHLGDESTNYDCLTDDSRSFRHAVSQNCFPEPVPIMDVVKTEPTDDAVDVDGVASTVTLDDYKPQICDMETYVGRKSCDTNILDETGSFQDQVEDLSIKGSKGPHGPSADDMIMGVKFGILRGHNFHSTQVDLQPRLSSERLHSCTVCRRCFKSSGDLSRHRRVHTGERPYPCRLCSMAFSQSPNRTRHMIRVHGHVPTPGGGSEKVPEPSRPPPTDAG